MVEKTSKITHIFFLKKSTFYQDAKEIWKIFFSSVPKIMKERIHGVVLKEGFS